MIFEASIGGENGIETLGVVQLSVKRFVSGQITLAGGDGKADNLLNFLPAAIK